MDKLISAESLLLSVRDDPEINSKHFARIKEHINHAPDAVKHGRWQWYEALVNPYALCSNCGCGLDKRDALNFAYCPYCGAKMDGEGGAEDGKWKAAD